MSVPVNVRVTTSESGFTVYATPRCSGVKSCSSWIHFPGIDEKEKSTTNGYFIRWGDWQEGTSRTGHVHTYARDIFGYGWYTNGSTSLGVVTRPYTARPITARLYGQDDELRSVTIVGTATPTATIRRGGVVVAAADRNGNWSTAVNGLPVGTSTLTFQQYVGETYRDQVSVSVTFRERNLLAGVSGANTTVVAGSVATVYGHLRALADVTTPLSRATVQLSAPAGSTFADVPSTIRGEYRTSPSGAWTPFASDDLHNGSVSTDGRTATFDWVPTRSDWTLRAGTELRFGITVRASESASGNGSFRMTAVGSAPQGAFDATGATPVTFEQPQLSPVSVTEPTTVTPDASNRFGGTATPGATFEVVDGSGTVIVPGGPFLVGPDGRWTFEHVVPTGSTEFRFAVRQTAFGKTETSRVFTIPADTLHEVRVTTTSVRAGEENTFVGTATPGATYRVLNAWGTEIVAGGPFTIDGYGRWVFDRVVSKGAKEFSFKLEIEKAGRTVTSPLFTIPAA
nr:hypothetical protein GCM10017610_23430 [Curtobacterium pusillum]